MKSTTEDEDRQTCGRCQKVKPDVEQRYSYGFYAGRYCEECAYGAYNDHCGLPAPCYCERCDKLRILITSETDLERIAFLTQLLDEHKRGGQGNPTELDEYFRGGPDAIWGEES